MKIRFFFPCLLLLLLTLSGCGSQVSRSSLSFSPRHRQTVCFLDGKLTFLLNDRLYYTEETDGELTLRKVEGEAGSVIPGSWLYAGETEDSAYLVNEEITKISKDFARTSVCPVNDIRTDVYTFGFISDGICYCIKATPEGQGGTGQTLKMFPLDGSAERTTLHVWKDSYFHDVIIGSPPEFQVCGRYLIMTYTDADDTLWVYDTPKQEMIIEGDTRMAHAAYCQEKLYFIDEDTGSVGVYDLKERRRLEDLFSIPDYRQGVSLACDMDYIYIILASRVEFDYHGSNNSQTLVYDYEGQPVDIIDLCDNADARALELCADPLYCNYMCSTDRYLFFGSRVTLTPGLFYVDKSQIGSGEITIHTLYVRDEPFGNPN